MSFQMEPEVDLDAVQHGILLDGDCKF